MLRFKVMPFVLTAALVAGGCSSDDDEGDPGTGPSGDQLSTVEFESMVEAFSAISAIATGGLIGFDRSSVDALALQTGSTTYSATENCPNGGTTGLTGNYTVGSTSNQYTANYTITQTFNNCAAQSSNGTTWTFNGNPNITVTANMTITLSQNQQDYTFTMTGSQTGGLRWSGAGKGGNCSINVNMNFNGQSTNSGQNYTYNGSYTGSVCGQNVNETFSYTI